MPPNLRYPRYKNAPRSGHSSQLLFEANYRNAQFLATLAESAVNLPFTPSRPHWRAVHTSAACNRDSPHWTIFATGFMTNN